MICGHSGEARNLAEVALTRGFDEVRILTWPIERLQASGLPLKPLETVLPYSPGITVERPGPVGDYRVPDGRYLAGLTGRLVELFTDGAATVAMSLYLSPHTLAVTDAVQVARAAGSPGQVITIAEAVGSDVTNVVRSCLETGRYGAAAHLLASYLGNDVCVAVSAYTRELILTEAADLDAHIGTSFAPRLEERIEISYPAVDTSAYLDLDPAETARVLAGRGLEPDGYVLFLSRLAAAKGVDDLIDAFARSRSAERVRLVLAGTGPDAEHLRAHARACDVADRIDFLEDVDDAEKPHLMAASAAYALPSKPLPEFTETFGIALVEKMLAGGGPVITTATGGIGEAVGDTAMIVPAEDPGALADALDRAVAMSAPEREAWQRRARDHGMQFDRAAVFDRLFGRIAVPAA